MVISDIIPGYLTGTTIPGGMGLEEIREHGLSAPVTPHTLGFVSDNH